MVRALEDAHRVVVPSEHERRGAVELEILGRERRRLVGAREGIVRFEPRAPGVGVASPLEVA